ncbi:MAG: ERF family protein [Alteromonadales bacterium]|nr:ERF family protein [Alteromonadales bacterium]
MTINEKLSKIQVEFKSKKSRFNSFGKYNFRSAEDILEATKPFLKELKVTVTVDEELVSFDPPVMQVTATVSDGKDTISSKAVVGVDLDQKGMQMPQRYGAASSYGKKYALGNLFLIDDTQDSDATNQHGKATASKQKLTNESLAKAKEYINKGGSIEAIKAKYVVTKKHEEMLTL